MPKDFEGNAMGATPGVKIHIEGKTGIYEFVI
jgi:hypothetical protein